MKEPTTPYSTAVQEHVQITRDFLLSEGWILKVEWPLCEEYEYSVSSDLVCHIGLYGDFSISELHWLNKTPEKYFHTMNPDLTTEDYHTILRLLNINL